MIEKKTTIKNETGLHARPASQFINCAKGFISKIYIKRDSGEPINAKSIVSLLSSGFSMGETVTVSAEGDDEAMAVNALIELIDSGFGEQQI
jgi:phosphocarrier protein HPr